MTSNAMEKGHTPRFDPPSKEVSPEHAMEKKDEGMRIVAGAMDVDPFAQAAEGEHGGDYIEYRNMGWIKAGALIMAEVRLFPVRVPLGSAQTSSCVDHCVGYTQLSESFLPFGNVRGMIF